MTPYSVILRAAFCPKDLGWTPSKTTSDPSLTLRMTPIWLIMTVSRCHPEGGFLPEGSGVNPFKDNIRSFATLRMTNIRLRMAEKQILR
jgi:hypothetical protein